jgi:hypothetical protein
MSLPLHLIQRVGNRFDTEPDPDPNFHFDAIQIRILPQVLHRKKDFLQLLVSKTVNIEDSVLKFSKKQLSLDLFKTGTDLDRQARIRIRHNNADPTGFGSITLFKPALGHQTFVVKTLVYPGKIKDFLTFSPHVVSSCIGVAYSAQLALKISLLSVSMTLKLGI